MLRILSSLCKLSVVFLIMSCESNDQGLPYYNTPDFTPIFLSNEKSVEEEITHTISDFQFTNHNNEKVTQKDIEGKIHVANFIFTICVSICPTMTQNMKLVEAEYKNDPEVAIHSHSVTPWIDTPDKLKTYRSTNDITADNWQFLTGSEAEIYSLARTSYFAEEDIGFTKDSTDFLHTEHFILVDQSRRIRGIYNGTLPLEVKHLIDDIKKLKQKR